MNESNPTNRSACENCGQLSISAFTMSAQDFRKNMAAKKTGVITICQTCKECFEQRKASLDEILKSDSTKRLIVAGPGTGKTFTFGEILKSIPEGEEAVIFTLINNLVDDLRADLGPVCHDGIKITTFHGFCRELLHSKVKLSDLGRTFKYFAPLPALIGSDATLAETGFSNDDFSSAFAHLLENDAMTFFLERTRYYNAVSHSDGVYRVFSFYREHPELIPQFAIVIGDEYQDFNKLEASFIDLLSSTNNVLLAGDDDQALYAFRGSSKDFIRNLYADASFSNFSLPFCSRCPKVVVDAAVHFVKEVQRRGLLKGRLPREYQCYWPDKYDVSMEYSKIEVAQCSVFSPTSLKFIQHRIETLAANEGMTGKEGGIPFLIIGPESGYHLNQVRDYLAANLDSKMFEVHDGRREHKDLHIDEGYLLLSKDPHSNLGWRVVLFCDPLPQITDIIKESVNNRTALEDMLTEDYKAKHLASVAAMSKDADGIDEESNNKEKFDDPDSGTQKIKVLLTNFFGSKGLSAEHCLIIGLSDGIFPINPKKVNDTDICKFLVALTRAKRSCCLVTNSEFTRLLKRLVYRPSSFVSLLPADELETKKYGMKLGKLVSK
jgi:superfamily I DNA/RNA helicase